MRPIFYIAFVCIVLFSCTESGQKIDRFALVKRHNVTVTSFDSLSSLTLGNGSFAFTVDATGLQTFPELYENGICLGTMSEWGWHSFPNIQNYRLDETFQYYNAEGRQIPYAVQWRKPGRKQDAANYLRQNPHRLQLAGIGLEWASAIDTSHLKNVSQTLDLWSGTISGKFSANGENYRIETVCHPVRDLIAVNLQTERKQSDLDGIKIRFPFPTSGHVDGAANWEKADGHLSEIVEQDEHSVLFRHKIDSSEYYLKIAWSGSAQLIKKQEHYFVLRPADDTRSFSFTFEFSPTPQMDASTDFVSTKNQAAAFWNDYWMSGGIVDFSGTDDWRAHEIERRVILSQYLTRVQCAGHFPPQETGLTFNSWYGKFHMEMHWWHAAHWAYWNRPELMEKSLDYYSDILENARGKALRQGYAGARWPKMTDNKGNDSPSGVGEFLIWQEPHLIYFAEQAYQSHPSPETLEKYLPLVKSTADFMASFTRWDASTQRYVLGPPLIPAQESLERETTFNPPFELAYWHWGLSVAQQWLQRLNLPVDSGWQKVIDNLSQLPQKNGLYLAAESAPDSYENEAYYSDHPMVLGAFGILPATPSFDSVVMAQTFDYIENHWNWERTWGWDYPMAAMCATRLGKPEQAVDLLLKDVLKNTYLSNGHNYQGERLRIYLPGNGGLLTAVAMMCAGFDGNTTENPGFPANWKVKWEGIKPIF